MIKIAQSDFGAGLAALVGHSPVRAARGGVLSFVSGALADQTPWLTERIHEAAGPLLTELGVETVHDVPSGLAKLEGRPPLRVVSALRSPEMVEALCAGLYQLGFQDLMNQLAQWGPQGDGPLATVPLRPADTRVRSELVDRLRGRAVEIMQWWVSAKVELTTSDLRVDGRTLTTAARVWQVPQLTGSMLPPPSAAAALYANRIGRSAAAVAFSKINKAILSHAPDSAVGEPLALLVALGEAITAENLDDERTRVQVARGTLPVQVRSGEPVGVMARDVQGWWPMFSAWGSSERRGAISLPTAWKLSTAESDVVVWLLIRIAVSLALAASAPSRAVRLASPFPWSDHVAQEGPAWELGATSVWTLMQRGRLPQLRTAMPEGGLPSVFDAKAWPWRCPTPVSTDQ
jgi:hypothetical protein